MKPWYYVVRTLEDLSTLIVLEEIYGEGLMESRLYLSYFIPFMVVIINLGSNAL